MLQHPPENAVGVFQRSRKFEVWCETVGVIHHSKSLLGEAHAVILIQFLITVYPSAAVDADDYRQIPLRCFRAVDIQQIPFPVRAVRNVVETDDIIGSCQAGIAFFVVAFTVCTKYYTCNGHRQSSSPKSLFKLYPGKGERARGICRSEKFFFLRERKRQSTFIKNRSGRVSLLIGFE